MINISLEKLKRPLWSLPYILPAILTVYGVIGLLLLFLDAYSLVCILLIPLPISLASGWILYKILPYDQLAKKDWWWIDLMVLIVVIGWVAVNLSFTSQHILTNRDPAVYAEAGIWLSNHDSLKIPATNTFNIENLNGDSAGFFYDRKEDDVLHSQGLHMFPVLLGAVGKIASIFLDEAKSFSVILKANVLIGAVALLGLYGLVRLLIGRLWGCVAFLAMSVSLPMIYFSRDTYSEPLSMALILASLSFVYIAQNSKDNRKLLWLTAGLVAGASALTRIDAYLSLCGLLVLAILSLTLVKKKQFISHFKEVLLFIAAIITMCFIGWYNIVSLSAPYYASHKKYIYIEIAACLAVVVFGVFLVCLRNRQVLKKAGAFIKKRGPIIAIILTSMLFIFLLTRPLWYVDRHTPSPEVAGLQEIEGQAIDPTRRYGENSMNWLSWYGGVSLLLFGFIGISVALVKATGDKKLKYIAALGVLFGALFVYLMRPSIYPDHIWAARRFLPAAIPGLVIFSVITLHSIAKKFSGKKYNNVGIIIASIGATLIIMQPLYTSRPFLTLKSNSSQLSAIQQFCNALPQNAYVVWLGTGRIVAVQATKGVCGYEAVGYGGGAFTPYRINASALASLAQKARTKHLEPVVAVFESQKEFIEAPANFKRVGTGWIEQDIKKTLTIKPTQRETIGNSIVIGIINDNGTISAP